MNGIQEVSGSIPLISTTSEQSLLCSDVFLCPGPKKTPSARFLAPPSQIEPVAPGLRFGFGCKTEGWHRSCCNVLKTVAWAGGCLSFWVPLPFVAHPSVFQCSGEVNSPSVRALLRKKRRASFALFLQNDLKAMENIAIIQLKNKNAAAYGCANTHMPAQVSLPPTQ